MKIKQAIPQCLFLLTLSLSAHADIKIHPDGKYEGVNEGYKRQMAVPFLDSVNYGLVSLGIADTGDFLLYIEAPLSHVDNSYGEHQNPNWQKGNSGKVRNHTFKDLLNSDMIGSSKPLTLNTLYGDLDLRIDYIQEVFSPQGELINFEAFLMESVPGIRVASSLEYNLKNVTLEHIQKYKESKQNNPGGNDADTGTDNGNGSSNGNGKGDNGKDKGTTKIDISFDASVPSTLPDNADNPLIYSPYSPEFQDSDAWIYHVGYEIIIDSQYYTADAWLSQAPDALLLSMGDIHASPAKDESLAVNGNEYCFTTTGSDCSVVLDLERDIGGTNVGAPLIAISSLFLSALLFRKTRLKIKEILPIKI